MSESSQTRRKAATAVFKLANKTMESGMHRTADRDPKGKGWVKTEAQGEWSNVDWQQAKHIQGKKWADGDRQPGRVRRT